MHLVEDSEVFAETYDDDGSSDGSSHQNPTLLTVQGLRTAIAHPLGALNNLSIRCHQWQFPPFLQYCSLDGIVAQAHAS